MRQEGVHPAAMLSSSKAEANVDPRQIAIQPFENGAQTFAGMAQHVRLLHAAEGVVAP
jgi:hypothetical protein